ncbi:family 43 glycosylhydrolase [Neobacillus niacini]|uniref:family 43 glycosylhydrolase n=1 Tax=Neobacillus niacini TaxID=86668 RepID=UPI003000DF17
MKKQVFNPFLPSYEYIPDGEPHVFNDRLYIFGSHDRFGGTDYCEEDYVCWSASVDNLSEWKFEGVIYRKDQHPYKIGTGNLYAPDVAKGPDGRYYLYYSVADSSIISVAVCDTPGGSYEYYGDLRYVNGHVAGSVKTDFFEFDPAVLVDDDGKIYLYSGSGQKSNEKVGHPVVGAFVRELDTDMLTLLTEPKIIMPADEDRTRPNFYEGSSVRKINGLYYFIYFSTDITGLNYCTSKYPDRDFVYRGRLHSSSDIGLNDRPLSNAVSFIGNNHGSIECINGKYYVFNHRQTNRSYFSRQAVAEYITIQADGSIQQAESTSCGLNGGPLTEKGVYPAYIACNLFNEMVNGRRNPLTGPYLTQEEVTSIEPPVQYIKEIKNGCLVGFKYFQIPDASKVAVTVRGIAKGHIHVLLEEEGSPVADIPINISTNDWKVFENDFSIHSDVYPIYFQFEGEGSLDMLAFTIS